MSTVSIYGFRLPENARLHKLLVAARMAGLKVEFADYEHSDFDGKPYLNNCHPLGRTPVLQTEDGYLFESHAILRHIARVDRTNSNLYGKTAYEASQVDQWLDYVSTEMTEFCSHAFYVSIFGKKTDEEHDAKNADSLCAAIEGLDRWLETRTFLVGERMTIADIAAAFTLQMAYRWDPKAEELAKKFKGAFRLYQTVMNQPATVEVLKEEGGSFGFQPKAKEVKPKAEKPKKEAKPAEEEEEEMPAPKKKPNPLDSLPATPFVLDDFKREYSNKDTRTVAAPFLFEHFDSEGWTMYMCKYKYNEDNKMQFMTANLTRGWFQRMEHIRKYGFGVALIVGEETKHDIVGYFFWRGKGGLPECVNDVEDTCLFDWTEIKDINAAKAEIIDYLAWDGETFTKMGKPVLEGRTYK